MKKALIVSAALIFLFTISWVIWGVYTNKKTIINDQQNRQIVQQKTPTIIDDQLSKMNLRQKIASLIILHKPGTDAASLKEYLETNQPGGLIFMSDNIPDDADQLAKLTDELQTNKSLPYLFAIDEEGGVVTRLTDDNYPSAIDLKDQPISATHDAFINRSKLIQKTGMNLNFGIVADVTFDPSSFIYSRVFGGDAVAAGDRVAAATMASKGITLSTLKHFPGHGEAKSDSHFSIPTTDVSINKWQENDKPSFSKGIEAGADFVMFGHLRYTVVDDKPASLSKKWHDILIDELNFKGITITDDMTMLQDSNDSKYNSPINNAVDAFDAGNTMLLYVLGNDNAVQGIGINEIIDGVVKAVESGQISRDLIDKNVRKVLIVRSSLVR